jgi:hypothetical protein
MHFKIVTVTSCFRYSCLERTFNFLNRTFIQCLLSDDIDGCLISLFDLFLFTVFYQQSTIDFYSCVYKGRSIGWYIVWCSWPADVVTVLIRVKDKITHWRELKNTMRRVETCTSDVTEVTLLLVILTNQNQGHVYFRRFENLLLTHYRVL